MTPGSTSAARHAPPGSPSIARRARPAVRPAARRAGERRTRGLVLLRRPTDAEPWQQPAVADHVNARELARQLGGRIPGRDEHAAAQLHPRRHRRRDRQCDERVQVGAELLGDACRGPGSPPWDRTAASNRSPTQKLSAPSSSAVEANRASPARADSPNCGTANPSTIVRLVADPGRFCDQDLSAAAGRLRSLCPTKPR